MEIRILRRREVERLTGLSKASIYRKMRDGAFPLPLKLGARAVAWRADEVDDWLASRPRALGWAREETSRFPGLPPLEGIRGSKSG